MHIIRLLKILPIVNDYRLYLFFYVSAQYQENIETEEEKEKNFWTKHLHVFFSQKFFPSAEQYNCITRILKEKYGQPGKIPSLPQTPVNDNEDGTSRKDNVSPAEQSEAEGAINDYNQQVPSIATASS